jgi:hypothetical protein
MTLLLASENCFEYSENPDGLKQLLSEIKVSVSEPEYKLHFSGDTECRNVYRVTITRGKARIRFNFGDSISNTRKCLTPDLYDILACCSSEHNIPDTFEDFISEFGYDHSSDSKKLFKKCRVQSEKLNRIFTDLEVDCLPR